MELSERLRKLALAFSPHDNRGRLVSEIGEKVAQLEAELVDRCSTIDAIDDGKGIDYFVFAQQETNRLLMEERERNTKLEAENGRLRKENSILRARSPRR